MRELKARLSVYMPEGIIKAIDKNMMVEGYSHRKKSKWIEEALKTFLEFIEDEKEERRYSKMVQTATNMPQKKKAISLYLPTNLNKDLNQAILIVRKYHPGLEGVKSLIIKAAILRRLYRYDQNRKSL